MRCGTSVGNAGALTFETEDALGMTDSLLLLLVVAVSMTVGGGDGVGLAAGGGAGAENFFVNGGGATFGLVGLAGGPGGGGLLIFGF